MSSLKKSIKNSVSVRRLRKEISEITNNPPPLCNACLADPDNVRKWTATIRGPPGSPYEEGIFKLQLHFPQTYPFKPPEVTFLTKIYHCNIGEDGYICLDSLDDMWSPTLTASSLLTSICSLITDPNPDSPMNFRVARLYQKDRAKHDENARYFTRKYAAP